MRKDRLYLFTFLSVTIIFILVAGIATQFFVKASTFELFDSVLESNKQESKKVASLIGYQLAKGLDKDDLKQHIQNLLSESDSKNGSIAVLDWSGRVICHPEGTQRGRTIKYDESLKLSIDSEITTRDFYEFFIRKQEAGEISTAEDIGGTMEVIYLSGVNTINSDWIVASLVNLTSISNRLDSLRNQFYITLLIMGFFLVLTSVIVVRLIGSMYEKNLESEKKKLEDEVLNLAKLNSALGEYQQKVSEEKAKAEEVVQEKPEPSPEEVTDEKSKSDTNTTIEKEKGKKRILTYLRNELLPVSTDDIAYIYTENTITYVVQTNGKRSTANNSLDELFSSLDSSIFYRANRQFIIAISSIEKIIRYGNSQLKILVIPKSEVDIIIGKNKASEFKQWLNL
ncbi:LytR/AlgR family response regulator transcription factor [Spongiimicrobium salis]|uniref:LytR/AlgR family response regulator transcription factor n=1 Tax=Spongiimicrobium salis TaxID=1667022 RepID=UPI00374CE4D9